MDKKMFFSGRSHLLVLLLTFPKLVLAADIGLDLQLGKDVESSKAIATGFVSHIVTDQEAALYQLSVPNLRNAVAVYYQKLDGQKAVPNTVYIKDPTPGRGHSQTLYEDHNWPQVKQVIRIKNVEILDVSSQPEILRKEEFVNNSNKSAVYNVGLEKEVSNTFESNWSKAHTVSEGGSYGEQHNYGLELGGENVFIKAIKNGTVQFEFHRDVAHSSESGGSNSHSVKHLINQGVSVELDPGEAVSAQLVASKGKLKLRVTYEAKLEGDIVANFYHKYDGEFFHPLKIAEVMKAGDMKNSFLINEEYYIDYFSTGRIVIDPL